MALWNACTNTHTKTGSIFINPVISGWVYFQKERYSNVSYSRMHFKCSNTLLPFICSIAVAFVWIPNRLARFACMFGSVGLMLAIVYALGMGKEKEKKKETGSGQRQKIDLLRSSLLSEGEREGWGR